jgi:hypothetical protein
LEALYEVMQYPRITDSNCKEVQSLKVLATEYCLDPGSDQCGVKEKQRGPVLCIFIDIVLC